MKPPQPVSKASAPLPRSAKLQRASAELLTLVWDSPFPALLLGPDDKVLDVNPAFTEFSGFARERLLGVDPIELQPQEDHAGQRAIRERLREDFHRPEVPRLLESRLIDASGRERWSRQARQRLLGADGRTLTLVTLQDCSAEHAARGRADRAARELDLAQMQIGTMMDTAGVGLATFQESTGWLPQPHGAGVGGADSPPSVALQAVGRDIVVAESLPEFEKVQHALRHTLRAEARYAIRHPELGLRWLLTRVEPATLASGKRTTSVVTLDITEQHQTQQRNEQLLHELTTILESASTGIAYLRGDVLVRCNRRFESMLGVPEGSGAGRSLPALFAHWPRAGRMVGQTMAALADEALFETEFAVEEGAPSDAAARWYSLSVRRTGADPQGDRGDRGAGRRHASEGAAARGGDTRARSRTDVQPVGGRHRVHSRRQGPTCQRGLRDARRLPGRGRLRAGVGGAVCGPRRVHAPLGARGRTAAPPRALERRAPAAPPRRAAAVGAGEQAARRRRRSGGRHDRLVCECRCAAPRRAGRDAAGRAHAGDTRLGAGGHRHRRRARHRVDEPFRAAHVRRRPGRVRRPADRHGGDVRPRSSLSPDTVHQQPVRRPGRDLRVPRQGT